MRFMVSPAEPPLIRALGRTSDLVERHGADIMWVDKGIGVIGVQRKEYTDLLSSVEDGRLAKEIAQLTSKVHVGFLVVEGHPHWTRDGILNHPHLGRWTREQYRSLLRSVRAEGITVEFTDDMADTIAWVESLAKWLSKGEHSTLLIRPKPGVDGWGKRTDRSYQRWLLQGIDGIGPKQADAIIDHFGRVPLRWDVSEDELRGVRGLGPKRIASMLKAVAPAS